MASELIPQKELAFRLGRSTRQIRNLRDDGIPQETDDQGRPAYPWPEALHWFIRYREDLAREKAAPTSMKDALERKAAAEAQLAELKVAREVGQLIPAEVHEEVLGGVLDRVRSHLLNWPGSLSPELVGLGDPREVVEILRPAVNELLEELRAVAVDWEDGDDDDS